MNAEDLFPPSEFLKSEDIEDAGGEMQLTIRGVFRKEYEEENGEKTVKGVLTFNGIEKKLTLNVTNNQTLQAMYGRKDVDTAWVGKTVLLYVDPNVKYGGKIVKGIRIRLIDEKQDYITAFWAEARKRGFTQQDGVDHVKEFSGDFKKALDALLVENPFGA